MTPERWYSLTARHGDDLGGPDFDALQVVRRTLLSLLGHGFIADFNTYSNHDSTVWSYRPGSEDPSQIMFGLLDLMRVLAPGDWTIEAAP
jgi:hypothetical protein